jgi:SET domain
VRCRPNCAQMFIAGRMQVRTLRAVAPGEELTLAYLEVARPSPERSRELLSGYCFELPQVCSFSHLLGVAVSCQVCTWTQAFFVVRLCVAQHAPMA